MVTMCKFIHRLKKDPNIQLSVSVHRSGFPSCCGIDLYCNIHIEVFNSGRMDVYTRINTDPEEYDYFCEQLEKQMLRTSATKGMILVSDGLDIKTKELKSNASDYITSMARFVQNRKWQTTDAYPNWAHVPANTAVFVAWKEVPSKDKTKVKATVQLPTKAKLEGLYAKNITF